jgi:hypothetical protein
MIGIANLKSSRVMMLPIEKLFVDERYQRNLNMKMVRRIAENFDNKAMGVLTVSKRDFGYAIIDGQHRYYAAKKIGIKVLECEVFEWLSLPDESKLFSTINMSRGKVRMIDQFRSMLVANEDDARNIVDILDSLELKIGKHTSNKGIKNTISCVGTLLEFYKKIGFNEFYQSLSLLKDAYSGDWRSLDQKFVGGFCIFFNRYHKEFNRDEFLQRLSKVPITEIIRDARTVVEFDGVNSKNAVAKMLLKIYNKGRRSRQLEDKFR